MPTYDYRCNNCGHEFELFQSMSEGLKKKCPACAKLTLERLIGTGAALIFKGSGFYETDYRSKDYKSAKDAETKSQSDNTDKVDTKAGAKSADTGKTESKSTDSKADKKPDATANKPKPTNKE
ncbi:MAG: zinc ribbon domain-containing protein [Phycisphaerales bacterium]